jgi:hypothetical protein
MDTNEHGCGGRGNLNPDKAPEDWRSPGCWRAGRARHSVRAVVVNQNVFVSRRRRPGDCPLCLRGASWTAAALRRFSQPYFPPAFPTGISNCVTARFTRTVCHTLRPRCSGSACWSCCRCCKGGRNGPSRLSRPSACLRRSRCRAGLCLRPGRVRWRSRR